MNKVFKALVIFLILLNLTTLFSCKKEEDVNKSFPEIVQELKSYKLIGKLESNYPSGTKECEVVVYYKSPNLYRVELTNEGNNEPQIMIKNNDGIYVLLPTVNKMFKVDSSWPNNSSYPYILQSLSKDIISDENLITTKDNDKTYLEFNAKMFDNAVASKQKVTFNNDTNMPEEVLIYDDTNALIMRFVVNKLELNSNIDDLKFKVNDSMASLRLTYANNPISFDRLVTYPTYFPDGASLVSENITGSTNDKTVFMKYGGDSPFTIIEQYVLSTEETKTNYVSGNIYMMGGAICIASNNSIFFYDSGMEYVVASTVLDYSTMIKMGESLRSSNNK